MFFSSAKINELESEIERLKRSNSELESENSRLISQNRDLESQNSELSSKMSQMTGELQETSSKVNSLLSEIDTLNSSVDTDIMGEFFEYENERLKEGLLDIQSNIVESTDVGKKTLNEVKGVEDIHHKSLSQLDKILNELTTLNKYSKEISVTINELYTKANDIGNALSMINEIVLQINILSLNASVEAASAGEAGKGFAVVAQEVKNLANKTSEVAKHIEEIVKTIQDSVDQTNKKFDTISSSIVNIFENTETFNTDIKDMFNTTDQAFNDISIMTDRVFMSLAKLDHVIWKVNTYLSVAKAKPIFAFVDHHNCRLGKWYEQGEGSMFFSSAQSYKSLEKPHSIVHNGTHHVFDALEKSPVDYKGALASMKEMEGASVDVFKILDKILHERKMKG
jgi:methyl-accepting chemotaxis protein